MQTAGISFEIQRKAIKNIHLHVKAPKGLVIVTAPMRTKDEYIEKIVREKSDWIKKQQRRMQERVTLMPDGNVDWKALRKQLEMNLSVRLPEWEAITDLKCSSWYIRKMKTRWGSCNTKTHRISFNLHLARVSKRCLDYIILHELLHVKIPNHGQAFKANMDKYMPNWREIRKELNDYILF